MEAGQSIPETTSPQVSERSAQQLTVAFGATRMAVGVIAWVSPGLAAKLFGLERGPQDFVTRLFGAREFALGLATLATKGDERRKVLMAGVAIDGVDTVAAVGEVRAGKLSNLGKIASGCGAALFAGLGVVCLAMEEDS